jgi:hypothetical protein
MFKYFLLYLPKKIYSTLLKLFSGLLFFPILFNQYLQDQFTKIIEHFLFLCLFVVLVLKPKHHACLNQEKIFVTVSSHKDRTALLINLLSLQYCLQSHSSKHKELCHSVISDGSLTVLDKWLLKKAGVCHFREPISKTFQAMKYIDLKKNYPYKYLILLDSDLIFFQYPKELFSKRNMFMEDYASRYVLSNQEIEYFFKVLPIRSINAGIGVFNTKIINIPLYHMTADAVKKVALTRNVEEYYLEQTAYAILMRRVKKFVHLDNRYFLFARNVFNKEPIPLNKVCIHYTTLFEKQRVLDSLKICLRTHFFTKKRGLL